MLCQTFLPRLALKINFNKIVVYLFPVPYESMRIAFTRKKLVVQPRKDCEEYEIANIENIRVENLGKNEFGVLFDYPDEDKAKSPVTLIRNIYREDAEKCLAWLKERLDTIQSLPPKNEESKFIVDE